MTLEFTIRNMRPSDYAAVFDLWMSTPGVGMNTVDDSKTGITRYLERNPKTCFVAEVKGAAAGVILSGHDGRRGYIYHLAVGHNTRGAGIGSALVEQALSALESEGIGKVGLLAYTSNESGNNFWEAHGFCTRNDVLYRDKQIIPTSLIVRDR